MEFVIIKTDDHKVINRACERMIAMGMQVTFNGKAFELPDSVGITDTDRAWVFTKCEATELVKPKAAQ